MTEVACGRNCRTGRLVRLHWVVFGREPSGRCRAAIFDDARDVGQIRGMAASSGLDLMVVSESVVAGMTERLPVGRIVASTGRLSVPLVNRGVWEPLEEIQERKAAHRQQRECGFPGA